MKKVHTRQDSTSSVAVAITRRFSYQESGMKLPMRVPLPQTTSTKTALRPPTRIIAPTTSSSRTAKTLVSGNSQVAGEGPRRFSMQARPVTKAPVASKPIGTGPQRVLVRPVASSATTKPIAAPSVPVSRLPGPTAPRRLSSLTSKPHTKIGSISKLGGTQIGKRV